MFEERIVIGEGTAYPLNGLLTLPAQAGGPVPAVVFVHGSGSSNMNELVGRLTPFKDLAEGLAAHGIASVRYDKRPYAHGAKMTKDKDLVITVKEEVIEDVVLAADLLRNDPRIDAENVFVVGHSLGGMLAPRIDAEGGNFRGLILMAGTPRRLEQIMVEQNEEALAGMNAATRLLAKGQMKKLANLFVGLDDLSDEEAKKKPVGGGTTLYYFKEMAQHSITEYLTACEKPMLVMQGEKDFQVKASKDFALYQQILEGNPRVTFKLYPGLNHLFVPALYDNIAQANKEYATERHIGEDVIADIATWIKGVSA